MEGWIKLHRKILQWEWYKTPNMYHLFSHLLLNANHNDGKWQGVAVKRGEVITGLKSLSANTGISTRSLRTCIERLKSTGEVTAKTTNKYSIITICNYEDYQFIENINDKQSDSQPDNQTTIKRQSNDNKQELKNDNNEDNISLEENLIKEKQEAEEFEIWRIENNKKNEEFVERERMKEYDGNKEFNI